MKKPTFAGRGLAVVLVALFGCSPTPGDDVLPDGTDADPRADVRIVFATHGQSADPFWSIVAMGGEAAGRDLGVDVEYQAPVRFDMVAMSNLIDAIVASRPSGLVVSIPDGDALSESIRAAVEAGIPVVSINSGDDVSRELGALLHVGQPEFDAGEGAGSRMAAGGVTVALCVNHEVGNAALDQRCAGFAQGLDASGATANVLAVDLADPDDAQQRIRNALTADPTIDAVLTLGPAGVVPALAALSELPADRRPTLGTFDLSPDVIDALLDGSVSFAIDQQPYLQGYLPVVALVTYLETLAMPGGGDVLKTGPGFVTADNAEQVRALSAAGLR